MNGFRKVLRFLGAVVMYVGIRLLLWGDANEHQVYIQARTIALSPEEKRPRRELTAWATQTKSPPEVEEQFFSDDELAQRQAEHDRMVKDSGLVQMKGAAHFGRPIVK